MSEEQHVTPEQQRRRGLLEAANAAYAELRKDPKAWAEHIAEADPGVIASALQPQRPLDERIHLPPRSNRRPPRSFAGQPAEGQLAITVMRTVSLETIVATNEVHLPRAEFAESLEEEIGRRLFARTSSPPRPPSPAASPLETPHE